MSTILSSLKKNKKGILLMLCSSICVCFGQLFWKLAVAQGTAFLILGFLLYAVGALIMIIAYRFGSLSVLQPMLSLNYVLSVILAVFILQEQFTVGRFLGIAFIMLGAILIGGGDKE